MIISKLEIQKDFDRGNSSGSGGFQVISATGITGDDKKIEFKKFDCSDFYNSDSEVVDKIKNLYSSYDFTNCEVEQV
ncbi:hypothetical protein LF65_05672 [Clostridium beijerinckii]|uniref:Uncharacterized protein n=1 Tax=Clostridium beijerinckii TaxID=1520 RepID=A0A0B5QYV2_CLOBE|nr:hypothetical protein [Clostridium beijerinckii]AJH02179.1 hypothetical protein LF65_05672 [Clostridium beijerinckii]